MGSILKHNILIVDNHIDSIKLYRLIFKDNYTIFTAKDTESAIEIIHHNEISTVIADCIHISASAIDLFEQIEENYSSIQRILVTDLMDHSLIKDAINRGRIISYINKPIDPKNLLMVVDNAIRQYQLKTDNQRLIENLKINNIQLKALLRDLKQEEVKFRNIFNSSPDPIFIIDKNSQIQECNASAQKQFYSEIINPMENNLTNFIYKTDLNKAKEYVQGLDAGENPMLELKMMTNDAKKIDFEINGFPVKYHGSDAIVITLRDLSERKEMEKRLLQSVIQTEEKERRRFAQELHDGIGPLLSTTKLYLQWFNKPNSKVDKTLIINKMEETLEETISGLREISNNISPNTLMSFGLNTALKNFVNRIINASNINIIYKDNLTIKLKNEIEITAYRLVCEFINNSIKHAKASKIEISIQDDDNYLFIYYEDNGIGFDLKEVSKKAGGNGLLNMQSRVQSLGGQLKIDTAPNYGTHISVQIEI